MFCRQTSWGYEVKGGYRHYQCDERVEHRRGRVEPFRPQTYQVYEAFSDMVFLQQPPNPLFSKINKLTLKLWVHQS